MVVWAVTVIHLAFTRGERERHWIVLRRVWQVNYIICQILQTTMGENRNKGKEMVMQQERDVGVFN